MPPAPSTPQRASDTGARNAADLELEFAWFARVVDARFKRYFGAPDDAAGAAETVLTEVAPPDLKGSTSPYAHALRAHRATPAERLALVLALLPHCKPQLLDFFHTRNQTFDRQFTEFGGRRDTGGEFTPTGQTLAFLVAGAELAPRLARRGRRHHCTSSTPVIHGRRTMLARHGKRSITMSQPSRSTCSRW